MWDGAAVDHNASDAELMELVRTAQEELEAHCELNQVKLLLRDFARKLLKQRLWERAEFVLLMKFSRPE